MYAKVSVKIEELECQGKTFMSLLSFRKHERERADLGRHSNIWCWLLERVGLQRGATVAVAEGFALRCGDGGSDGCR
jgi:hypothetical protein